MLSKYPNIHKCLSESSRSRKQREKAVNEYEMYRSILPSEKVELLFDRKMAPDPNTVLFPSRLVPDGAQRNKTLFCLVIIKKKCPIQPNLSSVRNKLQELVLLIWDVKEAALH